MNTKMIWYMLGKMMGVEACLLLIPAFVGLLYGEHEGKFFLIPSLILLISYLFFGRKKPEKTKIYGKDGMVIVALAWILWSVFGAFPYFLSGEIPSYVDALFETVSGFTTTGASILPDVEVLSRCMHFWRSFTQWIGGMGVLVFVMVLTSLDKQSSMHLMTAEVPGPEKDKLVPKMTMTARILYGIYFGMTAIEVVLLLLGGMDLYDSLIHAFVTAGTGGFSNYAESVAHFNSAYIDGVLTVFMIMFGINFNVHYLVLMRDFKPLWKNEELRAYFIVIAASTAAVTLNILPQYPNVLESFRYAVFQVVSIITTTGYVTADYVQWPMFSQCLLLILSISGGMASSTSGGVKISRILIAFKVLKREIKLMVHPKSVSIIRVNEKKVNPDVVRKVSVYLIAYIMIMFVSLMVISLDNKDFSTTFSSVMSALNNIGPGIGDIGPTGSFFGFSVLSKLTFCIDMLAGRLELFPILMLFSMNLWKKQF